MAQMEEDYKTAVHYVKSVFSIHYFFMQLTHQSCFADTLRKCCDKDELSKAKSVNQDLQGEITQL